MTQSLAHALALYAVDAWREVPTGVPEVPLLLRRVEQVGDCWVWSGPTNEEGYGMVQFGRRATKQGVRAHRAAYEFFVGPIPAGLQIDHLCRVRACVNPSHLEAVTCRDNVARALDHPGAKTHCPQGHLYDEVNTRFYQGRRHCIPCQRQRRGAVVSPVLTCQDCSGEFPRPSGRGRPPVRCPACRPNHRDRHRKSAGAA